MRNKILSLKKKIIGEILSGQHLYRRRLLIQWNSTSNRKHLYPEVVKLWESWIDGRNYVNGGDYQRFYAFILNLNYILKNDVEGSFAELGVYRGNSAVILKYYTQKSNRRLYLYDTFDGFCEKDLKGIDKNKKKALMDTSLDRVKKKVGDAEYRIGYFPETIQEKDKEEQFAFVSLDCDLYAPTKAGLEFFFPRLSKGGMIICHDYSSGVWNGVTKAVDEFCQKNNACAMLMPDRDGSIVIMSPLS